MPEETVAAESSSATVAPPPVMDVSRGPLVDITPEQRAEFRKTGNLAEQPKKEDAAPSSEAKPKAETETASEADKQQEKPKQEPKPKQTAAERIAELKATIAKIEKGAGIKTEAESSPAKPESKSEPQKPQTYQDWRKAFNATKWVEDYAKANPDASYEEANAAMFDFVGDVRDQFKQAAEREQAQSKAFWSKVDEARARYDNFDEVVQPTATAINSDSAIPQGVKDLLAESDVLPDILFTLGSDDAELAKFVKMAKETPGKALRYIALTESLIAEELANKSKPKSEEPPAKPQSAAPKPPSEVGGRAATPGDALESAAKANDFRAFKAEATRRQLAKLKS